jgi:predicted nuclease of predicted toxin-antitoxin system
VTKTKKPTFFIDRALGKRSVAEALRQAGAQVEIHEDHFLPNAPDTEWQPEVSRRGWVVLTKDDRIGRNILEQVAIASSGAKVFVLAVGNLTGEEMAAAFAEALTKMERFALSNQPPFIARVYRQGTVRIWQNHTKLGKMRQQIVESQSPTLPSE